MRCLPRPWSLGRGPRVYLLHFEQPYRHARHYIGWSENLAYRLAHHRAGTGARLTAAVSAAGGRYVVARLWVGTRADERRLKRWKNAGARICPICRGHLHACFGCGRLYRRPSTPVRHAAHGCPSR